MELGNSICGEERNRVRLKLQSFGKGLKECQLDFRL
jgi:hypothetical protein